MGYSYTWGVKFVLPEFKILTLIYLLMSKKRALLSMKTFVSLSIDEGKQAYIYCKRLVHRKITNISPSSMFAGGQAVVGYLQCQSLALCLFMLTLFWIAD